MMRVHEIAAEECVFAVLDAPIGRGRHRRQELLYQFEAVLPQPVEELQIVFSSECEGMVIACGCRRSQVHALQSQAELLIPESFPDWIGNEFAAPVPNMIRESLNLLTGPFQPLSVKRYERSTANLVAVASLVMLVIVLVASRRHIQVIQHQQTVVDAQTDQLFQNVLPPSKGSGTQPDAIRFATLMNTMQSTRTGVSDVQREDLIADLAAIFEGWPSDIEIQMQSLDLGKDSLGIQLSVQQDEAVAQVIAKLSELQQWAILSRTTTPRSSGVDLSIRFQRRANQESDS